MITPDGPVSGRADTAAPPASPTTRDRRPKVVALGGGHGLHAMLSALMLLDAELTAIVTVADDGGSSGPASPRGAGNRAAR